MRTFLLVILSLLLTSVLSGGVRVFDDFDFNQGGFVLMGIKSSESSRNELSDSLGDFYTDEIKVLQKFKKEWVFRKPGKNYACGYHYHIFLVQRGNIVLTMRINLDCEILAIGDSFYHFKPNKLKKFMGKLEIPQPSDTTFSTLENAREYRHKIMGDPMLIMTSQPDWIKYEGYFHIEIILIQPTDETQNRGPLDPVANFEEVFRSAFPDEPLEIQVSSRSLTETTLRIICNESLIRKFLYNNNDSEPSTVEWHPFKYFHLKAFWKCDPSIGEERS